MSAPTIDWRDDSACQDYNPDMWTIAEPDDDPGKAANWDALLICARCPVASQCLDDAQANEANGVIRGGVPFGPNVVGWLAEYDNCAHCGKAFLPSFMGGLIQRFCSPTCRKSTSNAKAAAKKARLARTERAA